MGSDMKFDLNSISFNRLIVDSHIAVEYYDTVDNSSIRIESDFSLTHNNEKVDFSIEKLSNIDVLQTVLDVNVDKCDISGDGHLSVTFNNGARLYIHHDQQYESWHIGHGTVQIHSVAGNGYAVFR